MNISKLGVHYRANKKSWMDEKIFREWLSKLDEQMNVENRNILLFLNTFSCQITNKSFPTNSL